MYEYEDSDSQKIDLGKMEFCLNFQLNVFTDYICF